VGFAMPQCMAFTDLYFIKTAGQSVWILIGNQRAMGAERAFEAEAA
jgi:hypothetical protein